MRATVLLLAATMASAGLAGCTQTTDGSSAGDGALVFTDIERGANSGVSDRRTLVVRDAAAWESLWAEHTSIVLPPPEAPAVDFSTEMVVAVFKGESPNGCHGAEILRIAAAEGIVVEGRWIDGVRDAFCTEQITHPFHMVRLPRHEGAAAFDMESVVLDPPEE